jgi:hypothetical protein
LELEEDDQLADEEDGSRADDANADFSLLQIDEKSTLPNINEKSALPDINEKTTYLNKSTTLNKKSFRGFPKAGGILGRLAPDARLNCMDRANAAHLDMPERALWSWGDLHKQKVEEEAQKSLEERQRMAKQNGFTHRAGTLQNRNGAVSKRKQEQDKAAADARAARPPIPDLVWHAEGFAFDLSACSPEVFAFGVVLNSPVNGESLVEVCFVKLEVYDADDVLLAQVPFDLKYVKNTEFVAAMIHRTNTQCVPQAKEKVRASSAGGGSRAGSAGSTRASPPSVVPSDEAGEQTDVANQSNAEGLNSPLTPAQRLDHEEYHESLEQPPAPASDPEDEEDEMQKPKHLRRRVHNPDVKIVGLGEYLNAEFIDLEHQRKMVSIGLEDVRRLKRTVTHAAKPTGRETGW